MPRFSSCRFEFYTVLISQFIRFIEVSSTNSTPRRERDIGKLVIAPTSTPASAQTPQHGVSEASSEFHQNTPITVSKLKSRSRTKNISSSFRHKRPRSRSRTPSNAPATSKSIALCTTNRSEHDLRRVTTSPPVQLYSTENLEDNSARPSARASTTSINHPSESPAKTSIWDGFSRFLQSRRSLPHRKKDLKTVEIRPNLAAYADDSSKQSLEQSSPSLSEAVNTERVLKASTIGGFTRRSHEPTQKKSSQSRLTYAGNYQENSQYQPVEEVAQPQSKTPHKTTVSSKISVCFSFTVYDFFKILFKMIPLYRVYFVI